MLLTYLLTYLLFSISGVSYAADFLSLCVMVHLLWPTRSYLFFNLKYLQQQKHLQLDNLDFEGLTDSDTQSVTSFAKISLNDDAVSNASELVEA